MLEREFPLLPKRGLGRSINRKQRSCGIFAVFQQAHPSEVLDIQAFQNNGRLLYRNNQN